MKIIIVLVIIAFFFVFSLLFGFLLGLRSAFEFFAKDPGEFGRQAAIYLSKTPKPPKK